MPRPRTPTNVLEMRGSFKTHPDRKREREGEPVEIELLGSCPEKIGELVQTAWTDLTKHAYWLTEADRPAVERAAVLLAALRLGQGDATTENKFINYIKVLGLCPTERSKVKAPKKKQESRWEGHGS